ncbi:MAG: peptidylprolyl isomerase [bacterium]
MNYLKSKSVVFVSLMMGLLFMQGCMQTKARPDGWMAKVGKNFITEELFNQRLQQLPEQVRAQFSTKERRDNMLDQLINEELLYMSAKTSEIDKTQAYMDTLQKAKQQLDLLKRQTMITELIKQKVRTEATVKPEDVKAYFTQNASQFAKYEKRSASHILVKTRKEALRLMTQLKKGTSFEKLAAQHSLDPTGKQGGSLGWFTRGQLEKSFEDTVFSMTKEGQISSVVKTQFGYHIIKLDGVELVPARTFAEVKSQIEKLLYSNLQRKGLDDYITKLKETYKVEKNTDV